MNRAMLSLYGLKWNPFSPEVPREGLLRSPRLENLCWRVENLARTGGFALVCGDVGTGKSAALRVLVDHLSTLGAVSIGLHSPPQGAMADFYRELGDLFGVPLSPHNRWAGAKALRERWQSHMEAVLVHAVLVIDEAQEMAPAVLNELRLLSTAALDTKALLTIVLCGDTRMLEKFRGEDLLGLSSRIRVRLLTAALSPEDLALHLRHAMTAAGTPQLMTKELVTTLCEHAAGNLRLLMTMANDLLDAGVRAEGRLLDEKLYFDTFVTPATKAPARAKAVEAAKRAR